MEKESEGILREWLAEYKSLAESSIPNYANGIMEREDLIKTLLQLFEQCCDVDNTTNFPSDLLQPICHQLFEFYKSGLKPLKYFTINLFPAIIFSHVVANSFTVTSTTAPIDALILSIFSMENIPHYKDDSPGLEIPQLVNPSIYHDPMKGVFADRVMNVQNPGRRFYQPPVLPEYTCILPSNRYQIMNKLLTIYCEHVAIMKKISHLNLCKSCTFLASSGFPWQFKYLKKNDKKEKVVKQPINGRRYQVGVEFTMTLIRGIYFTLYNGCWDEGFAAVEAVQRRARRELVPQVLFLANAVMNSARIEAKEQKNVARMEKAPFGLSSAQLTPLLVRESSRKGAGRFAATAKSIRDHKWRHNNEEISGDLSRSIQMTEVLTGKPIVINEDESMRAEKHSTSPSKLLKSKLKKSGSQVSGVMDKTKSPVPSGGDKKNKKYDLSADDIELDKLRRSPSLKRENPKRGSPNVSRQPSKSSMKKQPSFDETSFHSTSNKNKGISGSRSTNDSLMSTGRHPQSPHGTSYNLNESSSKINTSAFPLIDGSKLDESCDSGSEGRDLVNGCERSKESIPLLPADSSKQHNGTQQQTIF